MEPRKPPLAPSAPEPANPAERAAVPDPFPWLSVLETQNEVIDRDHREAVEAGNRLLQLIEARDAWPELLATLRAARERSARHFETEDSILEATRFPGSEQHRGTHRHILAAFDQILAELEAVATPQPHHWERAHAPRDLLVDHCLQDDLKFKSHLMHVGLAGK